MSSMPILATGAVQQYPYTAGSSGQTRVLRLADGSEQRYLVRAQRKSWSIQLRLLGESERQAVFAFAQSALRTKSTFAFTDPASGIYYPKCRVAVAPIAERVDGVARSAMAYIVTEVAE